MSTSKVLLTVPEAVEVLNLPRSKVYDLVMSGTLGSIKVGRSRRIPMAAIEQFVVDQLAEVA